jgi:antitoxin component of MazEF toxin-antitoxin module
MRKRLTPIGNSVGLILDKTMLGLVGLTRDDEVEITVEGDRLVVAPVRGARRRRFEDAKRHVFETHAETLRKLAK